MSANLFNGSWKNVTEVDVYTESGWKTAVEGYIYDGSGWKKWWPASYFYIAEYYTCPCGGLPASFEIETNTELTTGKYYYAGYNVSLGINYVGGSGSDGIFNDLIGPYDTCIASCPTTTTTTTQQTSTTTTTTTTEVPYNYLVTKIICPGCSMGTDLQMWSWNSYTTGLYYKDLNRTFAYWITATGGDGSDGQIPILYGSEANCNDACYTPPPPTTTTTSTTNPP